MTARQTFKDLATMWKYQGLPPNIRFVFLPKFEITMADMPDATLMTVEDLEGYLAAVVDYAAVPNVIEYTLTGTRRWDIKVKQEKQNALNG